MQQEIAINTGILGGDIDTLQTQLNVIKRDMQSMYQSVRVLDTMWDGPANAAFNVQFDKDYNDMNSLCDTVQKIIDCMSYAKNEYTTCENEVSAIVAAINV